MVSSRVLKHLELYSMTLTQVKRKNVESCKMVQKQGDLYALFKASLVYLGSSKPAKGYITRPFVSKQQNAVKTTMAVISTARRQKQEDYEFKASLHHM